MTDFEKAAGLAAWLTIAEAFTEFNIPASTLRFHCAKQNFGAVKKGKTWLIETKSLAEWISERSE